MRRYKKSGIDIYIECMWNKHSLWGMRRRRRRIIRVLVLVLAVLAVTFCTISASSAERPVTRMWVMCMPDGEVHIRSSATTHGEHLGWLYLGDMVYVDRVRGSWAHCVDMSCEAGRGWVHRDYLVDDPPVEISGEHYHVSASGRVAAWRGVTAKSRAAWLRPGDVVFVYAVSDGWILTDRGYVRSVYLLKND